jgi:hypothetical protein
VHCAVDSPHDAWLCDVRCAEFQADGGMQEVEWMVNKKPLKIHFFVLVSFSFACWDAHRGDTLVDFVVTMSDENLFGDHSMGADWSNPTHAEKPV